MPQAQSRSASAMALGLSGLALITASALPARASLPAAEAASAPASPTLTLMPAARAIPLPPPPPQVFAITPERRALLNTIRFAEGTWANGQEIGYRIMFGGGLMPSLDRHPDRVIRSARYASAAAGAYQFMPPTWAMVTRALGFRPVGPEAFGPQVQDQAAIYLIQRRGALALADRGVFSPELAHRLAPEWASFPTLAGRSFYGQPVKRFDELRRFYEANLAQLRNQLEPPAAVAEAEPAPRCEPEGSLRCQLEGLNRIGPRSRS